MHMHGGKRGVVISHRRGDGEMNYDLHEINLLKLISDNLEVMVGWGWGATGGGRLQ